jgi:predicted DNA-binding protein
MREGRYHRAVATNLRLRDDAAQALRQASERSGRSQQDLIREAVDRYLGLVDDQTDLDRAVAQGLVRPPAPFRDVRPTHSVGPVTTLELLDRDDR